MDGNTQLIGAAGVHFVAARMNALGLHAAATIRNVPGVDLLVSSMDGKKSVAIQVKTSAWASRTRREVISECQWACTYVERESESLFYAFVDLKEFNELPDIYLLPSRDVARWYRDAPSRWGIKREEWKWPRFHVEPSFIENYRNNFKPIRKALGLT